jgi:hypothetical protein
MSTEIEINQSPAASNGAAPAATPEAKVRVVVQKAHSRIWQRSGFRVVVGAALLVLVVGVVGDNVIARQYTADAAVRGYLSALESRNADAAWNQIEVAAPNQPVAANLTDRTALAAALQIARPDISNFQITKTTSADSSHAVVAAVLATSKGSANVAFPVDRSGSAAFGVYPTWRVVIAPTVIPVMVAKGGGGLSIDGKAVSLPAGKSAVAVLPLAHRFDFAGTPLLGPQTTNIDATTGTAGTVAYKPQLTSVGSQQAASAIGSYFGRVCTNITGANPVSSGCPQTTGGSITYPGQWHVVGDPGQGLSVGADDTGNLSLSGVYQMVFAYNEDGIAGTIHVPAGGRFNAAVTVTDSVFDVSTISRVDNAAAIDRPSGATDQAAVALVAKALAACAAVSAETVADCPQAAPDALIQNVHWKLNGDSTSSAVVRFDGATGLFVVHGNFSMSVSYTSFGQARSRSSYVTAYDAYLFWDGQTLQLVTIQGANS